MDKLIENKLLHIRVAQMTDELSGAYKHVDSLKAKLSKVQSERDSVTETLNQQHDREMEALQEKHRIEMEACKAAAKAELDRVKEDHNKRLIQKDFEIQRLRDSQIDLVKSCGNAMSEVNKKCENLIGSLTKSTSENLWLRQHHWGRSAEQARLLQNRNPLTRREEKELFMKGSLPTNLPIDTEELNTERRKKKDKKLRLDYGKHKPYTVDPHYISLDDYYDPGEGERLKHRNGVVEISVKHIITMVPPHFEEYFIETATVRKHGEEWKTYEVEDQVIPGVPFDKEMISFILSEHYSFNTTWANIAKKLVYYGIHISDSTLGNIAHRCISYLKKAMEAIWITELYNTNYWMIDETTALVGTLNKKGVKCFNTQYLWGIRANKLKLCWFIYDKGSRGRDVIRPYLDKFKGYFTTDGYVVYKLFEKMEDANQIRCACMTHIRRVFVDALHEHRGLISWFINKIKKLFEIEADCKDLHIIGGEERLHERTCRSALIMQQIEDKFNFYINNGNFSKLGTMTKSALNYINREWKAMKNVLNFGDAELSNNLCELMMRHVKINLKNSQNIGSEDKASNFCFMYSLVESCGFNSLSPMKYISHLLQSLRYVKSPSELRKLLPCYCKL